MCISDGELCGWEQQWGLSIIKKGLSCVEIECHDTVCTCGVLLKWSEPEVSLITGSNTHVQLPVWKAEHVCAGIEAHVLYSRERIFPLFSLNGHWPMMNCRGEKNTAEERRRRSGGCIVRESKGGVIRPNGSQMAGCQWREKRDELLIGTRHTQTPLNCRIERETERERENQTRHGLCALAK